MVRGERNEVILPSAFDFFSDGRAAVAIFNGDVWLVSGLDAKRYKTASINYSSIDHTAESIDLAARPKASTAHRDALQQLLGRSTSIADIVSIEQQVAQVQQEIDLEQGQANAVATAVELATARVDLAEAGVTPVVASQPSTMLNALRTGLGNADAVIAGTMLGLTSALPLIVVAVLVLLWVTRRRWMRAPSA